LLVELDGAGERSVVGERDGRHLEFGGAGREIRDPTGPVEDRELGVDVEVNELGGQGSAILAGALDDAERATSDESALLSKWLTDRIRSSGVSASPPAPRMRGIGEQRPGDSVREHLRQARALRKEMNRSADGVVRHLRRAAELLRRSEAASNRS
jgi:hypothetical protein